MAQAPEHIRPKRGPLLRALALTWLVNVALGTLIGTTYFGNALEGAPAFPRVFAAAALISSVATLFAVVLAPLLALTAVHPRPYSIGIVQSVAWSLALLALFVDTRVYALFRYHLNGMVWNVITTPGGQDTLDIRAGTWVVLAAGTLLTLGIQLWLWWKLVRLRTLPVTVVTIGMSALFAIVVFEKLTYAVADASGDRQILARAGLFPLYQRFTMKRSLSHVMNVSTHEASSFDLASPELLLHYPLQQPVLSAQGARPNILIVVVDSLRADMLAPETMPHVTEWSRGARVFKNHLSGGNATRFGVFSLVYGLDGTYWMPVYEERAPPVLVTSLAKAGYDMRVISAATMTYPEFRSTAWVTMQDRVDDQMEGDKVAKDRAVPVHFEEWMHQRDERKATDPFFCFVLLDAPHETYAWPADKTLFTPSVTDLDYLSLSRRPDEETIRTVKNSYQNAVHYADENVAALLDALKKRGQLENTVVVVTGDHGEEFWENGFFGHTSNFTPAQTHVTFVMGGPGIKPGSEARATCHVDLAPSLLEMLGADPFMRADWCQGQNLLAPSPLDEQLERERVVAGWQEVGVRLEGAILHVPLEGHKGFISARDLHWRALPDEDAFISAHARSIAVLARACRKFLR